MCLCSSSICRSVWTKRINLTEILTIWLRETWRKISARNRLRARKIKGLKSSKLGTHQIQRGVYHRNDSIEIEIINRHPVGQTEAQSCNFCNKNRVQGKGALNGFWIRVLSLPLENDTETKWHLQVAEKVQWVEGAIRAKKVLWHKKESRLKATKNPSTATIKAKI